MDKLLAKAIAVIADGGSFKGNKLLTATGEVVPGIGKSTAAKWRIMELAMEEKFQEIQARKALSAQFDAAQAVLFG
jgi:hypothetical protein